MVAREHARHKLIGDIIGDFGVVASDELEAEGAKGHRNVLTVAAIIAVISFALDLTAVG